MFIFENKNINSINMATLWQCKNCKEIEIRPNPPESKGCSNAKSHYWTNLGEIGNKKFICEKCGTNVSLKSKPNIMGCPNSANTHKWIEL